jgi:uncharacterized oligopeptide transporter (OPT) family protein
VELAAHTMAIWRTQVRFIGAGAIAVAAIYTLARLAKPSSGAREHARRVAGRGHRDDRDRDLAPGWILALTVVCLVVAGVLSVAFLRPTALAPHVVSLVAIAVPFVLVAGFLVAGVCGYMAGLIGASNSPISGVGILSIVLCASALALAVTPTPATRPALVAFALFVTAIVFACATISNDNLQDLKTGQLVGASPMRQQIALIVGVAAGAAVIPVVLNLLARAYGFAGAANVGVVAPEPAAGAAGHAHLRARAGRDRRHLEWADDRHRRAHRRRPHPARRGARRAAKLRIPPLAVGIGIYLPMSATFAVIVGAVLSHWYDRRVRAAPNRERAERLGTLVASGLIVGESLWGVLNAGLIVALATMRRSALVPADFAPAPWLGVIGVRGGDRAALRLDAAAGLRPGVSRARVTRRPRLHAAASHVGPTSSSASNSTRRVT